MVSKRAVFLVLASTAVLAGLVACGGGADSPTVPPTPVPTVAPTPTPVPTPSLPAGMTCSPTPPPLYGIAVKVQVGTSGRKTLDSRPQVINMNGYCESVGFGGFFCFTRREDDPQSQACDYLAVGQASDTGRWGPTWTADGKPCTRCRRPGLPEPPGEPVPGDRQGRRRLLGLRRRLHPAVDGPGPAGQSVWDSAASWPARASVSRPFSSF